MTNELGGGVNSGNQKMAPETFRCVLENAQNIAHLPTTKQFHQIGKR